MLEVELDIFSGMPNPTWVLSKRQEATLTELLSAEPNQISPGRTLNKRFGLGYRGLIVRRIKSDEGPWDKAMSARRVAFPNQFRIGHKAAKKDSAANWLMKTANRQGAGLADEVQQVVSRGVVLVPALRGPQEPTAKIDPKLVKEAEVAVDVPYKRDSKTRDVVGVRFQLFQPERGLLQRPGARDAQQLLLLRQQPSSRCALCQARRARWAPSHVHHVRGRDRRFARRRLERWLPAKRVDNRVGDLAKLRLSFLSPGDRRTILVVGAQARRYAGQIHRRLRACHLPVSR